MFAIALVFVLITVIGLFGNAMVLLVIATNAQMHESTSLFICNLALADLFFLAFCVPMTAFSYLTSSWPFPDSLCYFTVTIQYGTCYVSVWTLVLLAYDRFVSITSPNAGRSLRRGRAVFCICTAVWTLALGMNYMQMRNVGVLHFDYNGTIGSACVDSIEIALGTSTLATTRLFYWGFNLGAYLLPLSLSCVFYFLLVKQIWQQKLVQSKSSQKMKRYATRMVFVVIITFGLCWFPQNLRFFLQGLNYPEASFWEHNEQTLLLFQSVVQTLAYSNSCVNPILYGVLSERFRFAFRRTIARLLSCSLFTGSGGNGAMHSGTANFPASYANNVSKRTFSLRNVTAISKHSKRASSPLIAFGTGRGGNGSSGQHLLEMKPPHHHHHQMLTASFGTNGMTTTTTTTTIATAAPPTPTATMATLLLDTCDEGGMQQQQKNSGMDVTMMMLMNGKTKRKRSCHQEQLNAECEEEPEGNRLPPPNTALRLLSINRSNVNGLMATDRNNKPKLETVGEENTSSISDNNNNNNSNAKEQNDQLLDVDDEEEGDVVLL